MALSTDNILDEIGRATEILLAPNDPWDRSRTNRCTEAARILTALGFALAAQERDDQEWSEVDDELTDELRDRDDLAEVIAMGGQPPFYRGREYTNE
jgi:hypothetical protein